MTDLHELLSLQNHTLDKASKTLGLAPWTSVLNSSPPDWLVPGLLQREALHVLSSDSGCCKTWLGLSLMLSGLYQVPVLGQHPTASFSSIYLAADSPTWDINQQLQKLLRGHQLAPSSRPQDVHAFIMPLGFVFDNEEHVRLIADFSRHWDIDALFIDVLLYSHLGDENDNSHMARTVLRAAKYLRDELGLAIYFIHHNAKSLPGMPAVARGAGTIIQAAEHHFALAKHSGVITMKIKKTRGDELLPPSLDFTLSKQHDGRVLSPLAIPTPIGPPEPAVTQWLKSGTLPRFQLMLKTKEAGQEIRWLDNQLQLLRRQNLIQTDGKGNWSLCASPSPTSSPTSTAATKE